MVPSVTQEEVWCFSPQSHCLSSGLQGWHRSDFPSPPFARHQPWLWPAALWSLTHQGRGPEIHLALWQTPTHTNIFLHLSTVHLKTQVTGEWRTPGIALSHYTNECMAYLLCWVFFFCIMCLYNLIERVTCSIWSRANKRGQHFDRSCWVSVPAKTLVHFPAKSDWYVHQGPIWQQETVKVSVHLRHFGEEKVGLWGQLWSSDLMYQVSIWHKTQSYILASLTTIFDENLLAAGK